MRTERDWCEILVRCYARAETAARWAPVFAECIQPGTFSAGDSEVDDFLGQVLHESGGLEKMEENLNYSAQALMQIFGRHRISEADCYRLGRIDGKQKADAVAIANTIYGGPWGAEKLGNTEPGDGWDFRGSGLVQVTGKRNAGVLAAAMGESDVRAFAGRLRTDPRTALKASILWWEGNVPDSIMGNIARVTKRVNGGSLGLDDREKRTMAAAIATQRFS